MQVVTQEFMVKKMEVIEKSRIMNIVMDITQPDTTTSFKYVLNLYISPIQNNNNIQRIQKSQG